MEAGARDAGPAYLAADHFRYFAEPFAHSRIDLGDRKDTIAIIHEPLGVVGQIIPFNFRSDGGVEAAPALAPATVR